MAITFDEGRKIFKLDTDETTYLIGVTPEGYVGHIYYGRKLCRPCGLQLLRTDERPFTPSVMAREKANFLDCFPMEYPTGGTGDFRESCLDVLSESGQKGCELLFRSWTVSDGKPALEGLPASFEHRADESAPSGEERLQTLTLTLADSGLGLEADLLYSVFPAENIITRSVRIRNVGTEGGKYTKSQVLRLTKVNSACIDMEEKNFDMVTLNGSWARERHIGRGRLNRGIQGVRSIRGETSHQEQPFMALATAGTDQGNGEVWAMDLVYSGNFEALAEWSQFDSVRMTLGIGGTNFEWRLQPGETFTAPEAVLTYSAAGFGRMTRQFHDFWRKHMIRSPWLHRERPILINNWEATYFDFDTEKLIGLAREAKQAGIEMLVMDDGWFGHRNNDDSSLGDWKVNENKLQGGLKHLVDEVNAIGLKFGIWFEPEMISPDSELYRAHPDWVLRTADRAPAESRQQFVLDITRKEVRDCIYDMVAAILRSANIEYVKWDMNRQLTDLGSAGLPADRQGEISHRYVLALYEMQERLVTDFPELLLENCSGGGARFDAGMLYYSPQIWCSDDTDAIERLRIQEGTEMLYPLSTMGAHVSKCPNEQVGRMSGFETRAEVALAGTFGYELDITKMDPEERSRIPGQTRKYHRFHSLIAEGDYYRVHSWNDSAPYDCWIVVSKDREQALVTFVQVLGRPNAKRYILPLCGLDPEAEYEMEDVAENAQAGVFGGDELMQCGFTVPMLGDFSSRLFYLKKK
ncbi:MAG: alpha-galactosidase [Lachnospiraceae bacterium]|nr:alpha-galactosidase [Lachnospiraceae bacterium]